MFIAVGLVSGNAPSRPCAWIWLAGRLSSNRRRSTDSIALRIGRVDDSQSPAPHPRTPWVEGLSASVRSHGQRFHVAIHPVRRRGPVQQRIDAQPVERLLTHDVQDRVQRHVVEGAGDLALSR